MVGLGVGLVLGLVVGALLVVVLRPKPVGAAPPPAAEQAGAVPLELALAVLERLPVAVLALDASERVLISSSAARELALVGHRGVVEPLLEVAGAARRGTEVSRDVRLPAAGLTRRAMEVRVRAFPLAEDSVALLVQDVTEARRVDAIRRDFVANVSHEIKTPVGALALLSEAALESLSESENDGSAKHFLQRIRHESVRLGRLVTELIDLSRVQGAEAAPALEPVSLDDVLEEAFDRCAPAAEAKEITVVLGRNPDAHVLGSEAQLVTAVANLLGNAISYSPDDTRVAVALRRRDDAWDLTVTDEGIGIPEPDLDRIFERFYRVDPARSRATGGTGLGLAIVKHIVHNHGGEISVWSAPGSGSTFTVRLPGVAPEQGDRSRRVGSASAVPTKERRSRRLLRAMSPSGGDRS